MGCQPLADRRLLAAKRERGAGNSHSEDSFLSIRLDFRIRRLGSCSLRLGAVAVNRPAVPVAQYNSVSGKDLRAIFGIDRPEQT